MNNPVEEAFAELQDVLSSLQHDIDKYEPLQKLQPGDEDYDLICAFYKDDDDPNAAHHEWRHALIRREGQVLRRVLFFERLVAIRPMGALESSRCCVPSHNHHFLRVV